MTNIMTTVLSTSSDTLTLKDYLEYISEKLKRCVILNGKSFVNEIRVLDVDIEDISPGNVECILGKFDIGVHIPMEKVKYKNYLLLYKLYSDSKDFPTITCEELKLCVKKIDQAVHQFLAGGSTTSINRTEPTNWHSYNLAQEVPVAEISTALRASLFTVLATRSCGPINELKGISSRFNATLESLGCDGPMEAPVPIRKSAMPQTLEQLWPRLFTGNFFQFSAYLGRRALTVIGTPQSPESLFRAIAEVQDLMISPLDGSRMTLVLRVSKMPLELSLLKTQLLEFIPGPCRDAIHFTQNNSLQYLDSGYSEEAIANALRLAPDFSSVKPGGRDMVAYYHFITQVLQRIQSIQVPTLAILLRFEEALISGERDSSGATSVVKLRLRLPGETQYTRLTVSEKRPRSTAISAAA